MKRLVLIDADGSLPDYLLVIVRHPTQVFYQQQCAGTDCDQRQVEGYAVPVGGPRFHRPKQQVEWSALRDVFHDGNRCCGGDGRLPPERFDQLRRLVEDIAWWSYDAKEPTSCRRGHLRIDEARMAKIAEAWVPVMTPDGPGILTWRNCD